MKKGLSLILAMILVFTMLTGCGTSTASVDENEQSALKAIKDKGKLVLGTSADYPPYEFHLEIDGKDTIVGFDIDIANAIAKSIGVELEIVDMKFEGLLPALTAGKIDMIASGMTPTDERKESVDFSIVYYDAKQTMLVKAENVATLGTIESFDSKTIGVQKATIQEEMAKTMFSHASVKAIDKIPNLILELKTNKVDGLILVEPVAKQYAAANPELAMNGLDLGSEGGSAIAVQKGSGDFLKAIDDVLTKLIESGEMDELITKAMLLSEGE